MPKTAATPVPQSLLYQIESQLRRLEIDGVTARAPQTGEITFLGWEESGAQVVSLADGDDDALYDANKLVSTLAGANPETDEPSDIWELIENCEAWQSA